MRPARLARLGPLALALALPGCLEQRLDVEVTTRVYADGSCLRRTEYRFERPTPEGEAPPADPSREASPLRTLHRYPSGEPWQVRHDVTSNLHTVTSEALLPAPCGLDWDYWRVRTPGASLAARNRVSFAMQGEDGSERSYDYLETFVDPASPLAANRRLIELLARSEEAFADRFRRELGPAAPRSADVRREFRERLVIPAARRLAEIAERGLYGPREKRDLEDSLEPIAEALEIALIGRARAADPGNVKKAIEAAMEAVIEPAAEQLEREGLQVIELFSRRTVHFKVTLVMPAPVVRANACIQGDTVTWEFDQDDLYGRGFEMWARAVQP
jgi:hypothetical protein